MPKHEAQPANDLIGVLPTRPVRHFASRFALAHQPPPLPVRAFAVSAIRHRRNAKNPLHEWFVRKLADAA